jgi:hypothetical protein
VVDISSRQDPDDGRMGTGDLSVVMPILFKTRSVDMTAFNHLDKALLLLPLCENTAQVSRPGYKGQSAD